MSVHKLLVLILIIQLIFPYQLMAQTVPAHSSEVHIAGGAAHQSAGQAHSFNMDLRSTAATTTAGRMLTNAGNLYAVSTNPQMSNVTISATNIVTQAGALLTSVLPAGGLSGISGAISGLSLNLNALESIVTAGTIASAGALNLTAPTI